MMSAATWRALDMRTVAGEGELRAKLEFVLMTVEQCCHGLGFSAGHLCLRNHQNTLTTGDAQSVVVGVHNFTGGRVVGLMNSVCRPHLKSIIVKHRKAAG